MANILYDPSATQELFHLSEKREVLLIGGKGCLRGDQLIMTFDGPRAIEQIREPTLVLSHDGHQHCWAPAFPSFVKGRASLFGVVHDSGSFVSTGHHRVAITPGVYRPVDRVHPGLTVHHLNGSTEINEIRPEGIDLFWDLHVFGTNCYFTEDGTLHHNSGKSHSLIMKLLQLAGRNRGVDGGLLCPTLKMFKRDVLPLFKKITAANGIPSHFQRQDFVVELPASRNRMMIFHDEDDGDSVAGPNLGWGGINEVTLCGFNAYAELNSRIRDKNAVFPQLGMSGTYEGFDWIYENFIETPKPDADVFNISTRENQHVLSSYVSFLESTYDKKLQEAYIDGKIISFKGLRAAHAFNRMRHVVDDIHRDPGLAVWVSMDFNVDPMSATLWQRHSMDSKIWLSAFDEIDLPDSNTPAMADELRRRLNYELDGVVVFPDPAGNNRGTRVDKTDIDILKQAGFQDIRFKRIESVRDCLNSTNNALDKNKIMISRRCKNLIADLDQCVTKSGGREIDKSNPKRSHWLDGFKNMVDYEFPLRKKPNSRERQYR